ncbi:Mut7-C RNAse domain-containing protein [Oligoflexus tunisiensis]|uniref:Mut7-C RNAse domain-containing protein n=1 Tax=Oligoflexus tunisiensis TaxID=708132 RepID=UPI00114CAE2A|nr:Mut7-C RNAse domain-containing protein [Oligoflexus tunisiensis]
MKPIAVTIRFHEELNDFLPRHEPGQAIAVTWHGRRTVKDLIESLGVPHVEIDIIQIHGTTVGLDYLVRDQDDIDVHPGFHITRPPRFVIDDNVAKLVPLLRMLGFDTLYAQGATDSWIATISKQEGRTIVSRDKGLLKRKEVHSGLYVRSTRPPEQLREVVERLQLREFCQPFTRCLSCNGILLSLDADEAAVNPQIPPGVRTWTNEFFQCNGCHKVFWKGSHHQSMERLVHQILRHP